MTKAEQDASGYRPTLHRVLLVLTIGLTLAAVSFDAQLTQAVFTDSASVDIRFRAGSWLSPEPGPCVHSMGYWKDHPEAWPVEEVDVGATTYPKESAIDVLETSPNGDATYILAYQLIPALLNMATGADNPMAQDAVGQAVSWLAEHPLGSDPGSPDRDQGISLADILEGFNTGQLGPGSCDETGDPDPAPEDDTTSLVLEADPLTVVADGQSVVSVRITIIQDAGFSASDPVDVRLTTSLGTFAGGVTEGVVKAVDGRAQITLYAGTRAGTAEITAMMGGSTASVSIEFVEPRPNAQELPTLGAADPASLTPVEETPTEEPTALAFPTTAVETSTSFPTQ